MKIIIVLLILSICLATGFLLAFLWSVDDGQYEDSYSPSIRMLNDDDEIIEK